jgi:hypothetical protein
VSTAAERILAKRMFASHDENDVQADVTEQPKAE